MPTLHKRSYKECTTLCYIERDGQYLVMLRNRKEEDENSGKYIGIGGHVEAGETPAECVKREALEETGLTLEQVRYRGLITFVFEDKDELAFLYTCDVFHGEVIADCGEGDLVWVDKEALPNLPVWEGDRIFLSRLNQSEEPFDLKLVYDGDRLVTHSWN